MVSIIIPTFNSEKTIEICLKSVKAQSFKDVEVIVVDNFSSDKTIEIAKKYTDRVYSCGGERSKQRNFGIKKAKGEFIFYLDSDMVLGRDVIRLCVRNIKKNVALFIPEIVEGKTLLTQILNFERSFYNSTLIDAVRFIRRDVFIKVGGFDENLVACEDWDLDRRLSSFGKFGTVASPLYHLQYDLTFGKYIKKKLYYSKFVERYVKKWGDDEILKKQLGFKYRFFQVFVENGKWRKLIGSLSLAICMFYLKFIVGTLFVVIPAKAGILKKLRFLPAQE